MPESRRFADIAGGFEHMAFGRLEKYAGLRAIVLDLPHVIRIASEQSALRKSGIREGLDYVGGDMF